VPPIIASLTETDVLAPCEDPEDPEDAGVVAEPAELLLPELPHAATVSVATAKAEVAHHR
jgi:hypothetical protein